MDNMNKFKLIWTPIAGVIIFSILIAFAPMFSSSASGMTDLAPFTDYTYSTSYNTTIGTANSTLLVNRIISISEADDSDIAKTELLNVTVENIGVNNIVANITFNGVFERNLTAAAGTNSTYINIPITCLDGINTVTVGTYSGSANVSYRSSVLSCATALNGTDYSWVVAIGLLLTSISILIMILMFSGILKIKIFK